MICSREAFDDAVRPDVGEPGPERRQQRRVERLGAVVVEPHQRDGERVPAGADAGRAVTVESVAKTA